MVNSVVLQLQQEALGEKDLRVREQYRLESDVKQRQAEVDSLMGQLGQALAQVLDLQQHANKVSATLHQSSDEMETLKLVHQVCCACAFDDAQFDSFLAHSPLPFKLESTSSHQQQLFTCAFVKESEKRAAELRDVLAARDSRIGELEAERNAVAAVEQASTPPPAGVATAELEELRQRVEELRQRARELETVRLVWNIHFDLRSLTF